MTHHRRQPLDAKHIYRNVIDDEAYGDMARTAGHQKAFTQAALTLMEMGTFDSNYRTRYADQLHVAAIMGDFVQAQLRLDQATLTKVEKMKLKRDHIIPFNHAIERLIDSDSGARFNEVNQYLDEMYSQLYPDRDASHFKRIHDIFKRVLLGMSAELIGEQLAGSLNYDSEDGDVNDDLHGADRFFTINGSRWPVDIKLSGTKADVARADDWHGNTLIVAVPVTAGLIERQGFRLSPDQVEYYAPAFQEEIEAEIERCNQLKRS